MGRRVKIPQIVHKAVGDLGNPHGVRQLLQVQGQDQPARYPWGRGRAGEARSLETGLCHSVAGRLGRFEK